MRSVTAGICFVLALALTGCGFHFPTSESRLPASLSILHVVLSGSPIDDPPLLQDVKRALYADGVRVSAARTIPMLTISNEYFVPQVLVVDTTGRVSAYLLNYALSFELQDAAGKILIPMRTVKQQREYTFSRFNVLGEARQQRYLKHRMREEAIRKMLFQLSALGADAPPKP